MFQRRVQFISKQSSTKMSLYKSGIYLFVGAILVSISLHLFLVKNHIVDGGIVGVAIILSYLTKIKLGYFLVILNIPFLIIGYMHLGKTFTILSLYSILILAVSTLVFESVPVLTKVIPVAVLLGGILLGAGVGMIIRYGGSLDGIEIIAILLSKKTRYSIGQYIMFLNVFILGSSGFVFGMDAAFYSLTTYIIAFQTIDMIICD